MCRASTFCLLCCIVDVFIWPVVSILTSEALEMVQTQTDDPESFGTPPHRFFSSFSGAGLICCSDTFFRTYDQIHNANKSSRKMIVFLAPPLDRWPHSLSHLEDCSQSSSQPGVWCRLKHVLVRMSGQVHETAMKWVNVVKWRC
jgi:hypothetical protein